MIPDYLKNQIRDDDLKFEGGDPKLFVLPEYNPKTHYLELTQSGYFQALITLRHNVKMTSDFYWSEIIGAYNLDLFMLTPSVSSPMGPGSDSEAVEIQFGKLKTFLVDSSQFGFEPILMNGFNAVYCYLPSMRGENPDKRHLNQFYHCEAEIRGTINELYPKIEDYVRFLAEAFLMMPNILRLISLDYNKTYSALEKLTAKKEFESITFNDATELLAGNGFKDLINKTNFGSDITSDGELRVLELLGIDTPVWVKNYDRDRVPFYQKPDPVNSDKVINADLIFPPILSGAFGGEIIGCGQRQDNYDEMLESLNRQGIVPDTYEWYMNLRKMPNYKTTSGFGLGIERFITWALGRDDIKDAILYPRLKNILTYP